jgi:hypothetical protein
MKEIIIRLGTGTIQDGFTTVTVELKSGTTQWEDRSNLPVNPELHQLLNEWQLLYPAAIRLLSTGMNLSSSQAVFDTNTVSNVSSQDMVELNYNFKVSINNWLNFGDFGRIGRQLRRDLDIHDRISVIIVSSELKIWQLPWHFWDLFSDYPDAVEVFSKPKFTNVRHIRPQCNGRVNILALSGRDPRANINLDFLATLPKCSYRVDKRSASAAEVATQLQEFKPDVFIFYGHGDTIQYHSFQEGVIYLDNDTPLQISTLKNKLQAAIESGLQIAVFNCCNGLGLAEQIIDLNIPYVIVMREVIPNQTAQEFLENLLTQYSQGQSFSAAFNYARQQLKLASGGFAQFADWLPILFHNPLSDSVTWQDLSATIFSRLIPPQLSTVCRNLSQPNLRIWTSVGLSLLGSLLALSLHSHPQIAVWENAIVERVQAALVKQMPLSPSKVVIVSYDEIIFPGLTIDNDNLLMSSIEQIEKKAKPLAWAIDLEIGNNPTTFNKHIIQGCTNDNQSSPIAKSYHQLDLCQRQLIDTLAKIGGNKSVSQDFKLNSSLLIGNKPQIDRVNLSELVKAEKSEAELKQLLANKFAIVGSFNGKEINAVGLEAIALDQIIRANDRTQNLLPLVSSRSIGEQFLWIFIWSILTGILMWHRQWKLFLPLAIVSEIAITGGLFLLGQGLPIIMTPLAMMLVGATVRVMMFASYHTIDRQPT